MVSKSFHTVCSHWLTFLLEKQWNLWLKLHFSWRDTKQQRTEALGTLHHCMNWTYANVHHLFQYLRGHHFAVSSSSAATSPTGESAPTGGSSMNHLWYQPNRSLGGRASFILSGAPGITKISQTLCWTKAQTQTDQMKEQRKADGSFSEVHFLSFFQIVQMQMTCFNVISLHKRTLKCTHKAEVYAVICDELKISIIEILTVIVCESCLISKCCICTVTKTVRFSNIYTLEPLYVLLQFEALQMSLLCRQTVKIQLKFDVFT